MKTLRLNLVVLSLLCLSAATSQAEVLTISPQRLAVLPEGQDEITQVALYFDISVLPDDENLVIDMAYLEWTPSNSAVEASGVFRAFEVTGDWEAEETSLTGELDVSEVMATKCRVEPVDFERTSGLLRFELTPVVSAWVEGARANYGVMIASQVLSRTDAVSRLDEARLVVRYRIR